MKTPIELIEKFVFVRFFIQKHAQLGQLAAFLSFIQEKTNVSWQSTRQVFEDGHHLIRRWPRLRLIKAIARSELISLFFECDIIRNFFVFFLFVSFFFSSSAHTNLNSVVCWRLAGTGFYPPKWWRPCKSNTVDSTGVDFIAHSSLLFG